MMLRCYENSTVWFSCSVALFVLSVADEVKALMAKGMPEE